MNLVSDVDSGPLWISITALVISVILAIFKAVEFFRKPRLYLHLTRDIFFRLIDGGEALFCNAVLLASNGPILIRSVQPVLKRIDCSGNASQAEKSFPLTVAQYGEKVRGANLIADHHFFGSSPLLYIEASKPYRAVYLCFQKEYQNRQKRAVDNFSGAFEKFRAENPNLVEEQADSLRSKFTELIEFHFNSIVNLIQLEAGEYELYLTVKYVCVGWKFWGKTCQTTSHVRFSIDDTAIDRWKFALKNTLSTRGSQIVSGITENIVYPELEPRSVTEFP